jgi:triosephosphate isomerase (TIM)
MTQTSPKLFIANWKMNPSTNREATNFFELYSSLTPLQADNDKWSEIVVCTPSIYWHLADKKITLGAQDVSSRSSGAFTGEISAGMLVENSVKYCLIGHSESRLNLGYSNQEINSKLKACLERQIIPVLCVGYEDKHLSRQIHKVETHSNNELMEELANQIILGLAEVNFIGISPESWPIIAYEPVWAIGTGVIPDTQTIRNITLSIKALVKDNLNLGIDADKLKVLYGGSVKADNYEELLDIDGLDGLLIGGASLQVEQIKEMLS